MRGKRESQREEEIDQEVFFHGNLFWVRAVAKNAG